MERALELQERRVERGVVGVDEPEVDLALVAEAGAVERDFVLFDERRRNAAPGELEGHARALQAGPEHEHRGLDIRHESVSGFYTPPESAGDGT